MRQQYLKYWGKTSTNEDGTIGYHPVAYHCLDVAAVLTVLIEKDPRLTHSLQTVKFCDHNHLVSIVQLLAALHDVGKFSESFQRLKPELYYKLQNKESNMRYYPRHDSAGFLLFRRFIWKQLRNEEQFPQFSWDPDVDEYDCWERFRPLISAITGHHGEPPSEKTVSWEDLFSSDVREDIISFIKDCVSVLFSISQDERVQIRCTDENFNQIKQFSFIFAGGLVLADWIASNTDWFPYVTEEMNLKDYWEGYAEKRAKLAVDKTGILPVPVSLETGFSHLFPKFSPLHPVQQYCNTCTLESGPSLYIIEDQCGMGKTEAAIVLAHRLMAQGGGEGIFFALPTMATANAMYPRLDNVHIRLFKSSVDTPEVILTHSRSKYMKKGLLKDGFRESQESDWYDDDDTTATFQAVNWLSESRKTSLLAQIGVGTIDQALIAILPIKHQSLRLYGLAHHILIVDEVHSYDTYMHILLCKLIEYHISFGGSVILLSATLPLKTRKEFVSAYENGIGHKLSVPTSLSYPLITSCIYTDPQVREFPPITDSRSEIQKKRLEFSAVHSHDEVLDCILTASAQGLCVAYIRNTVRDALETYDLLKTMVNPAKLMLFHARYTLYDRLNRENEVLKRFGEKSLIEDRKGMILIATQVIEQSLDVDFDLMVTDLAPVDLLLQRAGRIHRHPDLYPHRIPGRGPAKLVIYSPKLVDDPKEDWYRSVFPGGGSVYEDHGILYLSLKTLIKTRSLIFPDEITGIRSVIEEVYSEKSLSSIPEGLRKITEKNRAKKSAQKSYAMMNGIPRNKGYIFTESQWDDDVHTPTRLSELSVPLFLGKMEGSCRIPFHGTGFEGWMMSQIMVREKQIPDDYKLFEDFPADLPGKGRDRILIILEEDNGNWTGIIRGVSKSVQIVYNQNRGLEIVPI